MQEAPWTLDALNARVRDALAGYVPGSSARVRAIPDRRTIRYYTTLGLIDRAELKGRVAYYGRRHLLQIVAIKRLQAQGLTLTRIQERLAGLSETALEQLAQLGEAQEPAPETPRRRRASFWEDTPAELAVPSAPEPQRASPHPRLKQGIDLAAGVTLILPSGVTLDLDDCQEIDRAAAPLLTVLKSKGIIA